VALTWVALTWVALASAGPFRQFCDTD